MSATIEVTRDTAALLRALASCCRHLPAAKRAQHLAAPAEALAQRIERAGRDQLAAQRAGEG